VEVSRIGGNEGTYGVDTNIDPGSANQMGSDHAEEFTGTDDLGVLPEFGKMSLVSRHQVVGTCSIGTFNEHVVRWVGGDLIKTRGCHDVSVIFDQLQELLP
jgi:hypothetical protein